MYRRTIVTLQIFAVIAGSGVAVALLAGVGVTSPAVQAASVVACLLAGFSLIDPDRP